MNLSSRNDKDLMKGAINLNPLDLQSRRPDDRTLCHGRGRAITSDGNSRFVAVGSRWEGRAYSSVIIFSLDGKKWVNNWRQR